MKTAGGGSLLRFPPMDVPSADYCDAEPDRGITVTLTG
jgi:hypothetical protein